MATPTGRLSWGRKAKRRPRPLRRTRAERNPGVCTHPISVSLSARSLTIFSGVNFMSVHCLRENSLVWSLA